MPNNKFNITLILLIASFIINNNVIAKQATTVDLLEDLQLNSVETEVIADPKSLVRNNSSLNKKNIKLLGKAKVSNIKNDKIVQIIWYGVATKDLNKNKTVMLKKPGLSSLQTNTKLQKIKKDEKINLKISEKYLQQAIENLLNNKELVTNPQTIEVADNLKSDARHIAVLNEIPNINNNQKHQTNNLEEQTIDNSLKEIANYKSSNKYKNTAVNNIGSDDNSSAKLSSLGLSTNNSSSRNLSPNKDRKIAGLTDAETKVEITATGCSPRIDEVHNKVIIQKQAIVTGPGADSYPDNRVCKDTFETYSIEKDYQCSDCDDQVDLMQRVAHDRYRNYWIDPDNIKQWLPNSREVIDTSAPHPFIDEVANCNPEIDLVNDLAYPTVETVYYNRNNARVVVAACHRAPDKEAIPIVEVEAGCKLRHDLHSNITYIRKRKIFTVDGIEHVARSCEITGEPLEHNFDTHACTAIRNPVTGQLMSMARRRIRHPEKGEVYITECEPLDNTGLLATTQGCENDLFTHELDLSISYVNKRYYLPDGNNKKFLTSCVRSSEVINHLPLVTEGYTYEDLRLQSYPKQAIYLQYNDQQHLVSPAKVRDELPIAHTKVENFIKTTTRSRYQGCFKITEQDSYTQYRRPDNTTHDVYIGPAASLTGPNECRNETRIEVRNIPITSSCLLNDGGGRDDPGYNYVGNSVSVGRGRYSVIYRHYPGGQGSIKVDETFLGPT